MRKTILLTFFIFALSVGVFGQKPAVENPFTKKNRVFWMKNNSCCNEEYSDGAHFRTFSNEDISLMLRLGATKRGTYLLAGIIIFNLTNKPMNVITDDIRLETWAKPEDVTTKPPKVFLTLGDGDSLKSNTLEARGRTRGTVSFKVRKSVTGFFIIKIEGIEYVFMFSAVKGRVIA